MVKFTVLISGIFMLAACANTAPIMSRSDSTTSPGGGKTSVSAFSQFPDIPIPSGARINMEKTLVFGTKP